MHSLQPIRLLAAGLLIALPLAGQSRADSAKPHVNPQAFVATLSGAKEVPAVTTKGSGTAHFWVKDSTIHFELTVHGISGVTAAHIHLGAVGANGAPVATLYAGKNGSGKLAHGVLTAKDLNGTTVDALVSAMQTGQAYVNVHTKAHPGGELRGEIEPAGSSMMSQMNHKKH